MCMSNPVRINKNKVIAWKLFYREGKKLRGENTQCLYELGKDYTAKKPSKSQAHNIIPSSDYSKGFHAWLTRDRARSSKLSTLVVAKVELSGDLMRGTEWDRNDAYLGQRMRILSVSR
jgi:hypothetical protein